VHDEHAFSLVHRPVEVVGIFRRMQEIPTLGNQYRINRGIKPAANNSFFIEKIEDAKGGLHKQVQGTDTP